MAIEKLLADMEVSRRELAATDYQVIREIERLLPRLKQLLDDSGADTSDVDLAGIDEKKRGEARARIKAEKTKKARKK